MFGFLVVDKPRGITSRTTLDRLLRFTRPVKAGHAGTLDPLATGVLVLCLGPATRLVSLVQGMPKSYRATFRLGYESETEDSASPLIPVAGAAQVSQAALQEALCRFEGTIPQKPPLYSALRLKGRRAYDLARAGKSFDLPPREVCVHRIELIRFDGDEFELDIQCGSGTYVRSLGRDVGRELGSGAVMTSLRRTAIGPFALEDAVDVSGWNQDPVAEQLRKRLISPVRVLSQGMGLPEVTLLEPDVQDLWHGRRLKPLAAKLSEQCFSSSGRWMGIDRLGRLMAILKRDETSSKITVEINFSRYWSEA